LELNGTHHLLVFVDYVNTLGKIINTTKKNNLKVYAYASPPKFWIK